MDCAATGGRVSGVATAAGAIPTEQMLVAAGSWADRLFSPLHIELGLEPTRIQVVLFRCSEALARRGHRVVIDAINHSWPRPEGGNCTLIGAERSVMTSDPDLLDESVDAAGIPTSRRALAARIPIFARAVKRGGRSGTYKRSPVGHPAIDQIPSLPGLWVMTGDSGTSFQTMSASGVCLDEWITEGASRLVDLTPFRANRFANGELWRDAHSYGDGRQLTVSR